MSRTSVTIKPLVDEAEIGRAARFLIPWASWRAISETASRIVAWRARHRAISRTVDALSGLSDHQLMDIGIHRSEIASIARSDRNTMQDRWRLGAATFAAAAADFPSGIADRLVTSNMAFGKASNPAKPAIAPAFVGRRRLASGPASEDQTP